MTQMADLIQRLDDLDSAVEYAKWLGQSALDAAAVHVQAAPVSMEDFATFRLGILGLLLERLCDEDQNPVILADLVKRMNVYEALGHEHTELHEHTGEHYSAEPHDHDHPQAATQASPPVIVQVVQPPQIVVPTLGLSCVGNRTQHYGGPFSVTAEFSESLRVGFRTVKDHGFEVEGGKVTGVRRVNGRSDLWQIVVDPKRRQECTITSTNALVCVSGVAPHPISIVIPYAG